MPDAAELIAVARFLVEARSPTDAHLRRAVSTAYYALFHKVLRAASNRFIGPGKAMEAGYAIFYRGFNHNIMKSVCEEISKPNLSKKYRSVLGRQSVTQKMRDFATLFPALQERRHAADYDPSAQFGKSAAISLIDAAEVAMAAFDETDMDEQANVLALLMLGLRS